MTKAKEPETLLGSHNLLPLGAGVLEEARRVAQRARVVCMVVPLLLRRPGVPAAPRYAHEQRPMLEAEHTQNADSPETLRICTSTKQCLDKVHMLLSWPSLTCACRTGMHGAQNLAHSALGGWPSRCAMMAGGSCLAPSPGACRRRGR